MALSKTERLLEARKLVLRALSCIDWHLQMYESGEYDLQEDDIEPIIEYAERISKYIQIPPDLLGD